MNQNHKALKEILNLTPENTTFTSEDIERKYNNLLALFKDYGEVVTMTKDEYTGILICIVDGEDYPL